MNKILNHKNKHFEGETRFSQPEDKSYTKMTRTWQDFGVLAWKVCCSYTSCLFTAFGSSLCLQKGFWLDEYNGSDINLP